MSSIKIPQLDLYTHTKNHQRMYQTETVQQQGIDLLSKTRHGGLLHEAKAQRYLQTYKSNLTHFISPSKYRDEAENLLKKHVRHEDIMMKALTFPTPKYHCPKCYHEAQQENRKCYC
jgi:hypothetical protein